MWNENGEQNENGTSQRKKWEMRMATQKKISVKWKWHLKKEVRNKNSTLKSVKCEMRMAKGITFCDIQLFMSRWWWVSLISTGGLKPCEHII